MGMSTLTTRGQSKGCTAMPGNVDTNTLALYCVYLAIIVLDLLAGYFKVLDTLIVASIFSATIAHFWGIQVPSPTQQKTILTLSQDIATTGEKSQGTGQQ
jgi:hypothetical protein